MRNFEERDEQYKTVLNEKLQIADSSSLIQVSGEDLSSRASELDLLASG